MLDHGPFESVVTILPATVRAIDHLVFDVVRLRLPHDGTSVRDGPCSAPDLRGSRDDFQTDRGGDDRDENHGQTASANGCELENHDAMAETVSVLLTSTRMEISDGSDLGV
jgi:hypothetical protein